MSDITKIGSLIIRNTKGLLSPETRLCGLVYTKAKKGKTVFASGLDAITKKYRGKPSLFIACEAAEGGGTASVEAMGVDYVQPQTWGDMEQLLAQLTTNETYGGIILDNATDYVSRIVKPHALTFPPKETQLGARLIGVPVRSDYQVMGEAARTQLNRLVNLTNSNTPERYRKDLIVTALEKENTNDSGGITSITPDLPGAMSSVATAMFQEVGCIAIRQKVVPDLDGKPGATKKITERYLHVKADGIRVSDSRLGIFQDGFVLTDDKGNPISMLVMYEKWLERFKNA